ncbi:glycosyltransferase family 2 protein [Isoptericola sp. 4D.3]|uniref:Glycosyltransferase family 2 protein n=1 Tax=Isoptericola peretonis TaxID=2918523 RepID=A0ABT0J698_9MICO|nr:glycosyltransferase family 2 protein [Isoptericola sp. 4D.3]
MRALDRWRSSRARPAAPEPAAPEAAAPGDRATDVPLPDIDPAGARVAVLSTAHQTFLSVKGSRLDQARRGRSRARLLWQPGADLGLLVGDDLDHEFGLGPGTPRSLGHLVRLAWSSETTVAIADLWSRTWLSAAPVDDAEAGSPRIRTGATAVGPDETFTVGSHGTADGDPTLTTAAVVYAEARDLRGSGGVQVDDVLATLDDTDTRRARMRLSTLLPLLSYDSLQELARAVLASTDRTSALAAAFPTDPWATRSLPGLREWLQDRDTGWRRQEVGTDLDVLWPAGPGDVAASSGETIASAARATVRPRRRVCVVATARNEGVYLLEWLAYYRALGVDEFFVYSNNNEDGSDLLLRALADAGAIRWLDSSIGPGTKAQAKAYAHAFSVLPEVLDYTWAMTVDIDEFLVLDPVRFDGLADFLDWHATRQTDVIGVNWVVVGPSGLTRWEDDLVTRRFPARIAPVDSHIKSISRPGRILGSQPHFPYTAERERLAFREATGEPHTSFTSELAPHLVQAQSDHPTTGHAALHHYALKSAEEFLWKFSRNRGGRVVATDDAGLALTLEERFVRRFLAQLGKDAGDVRPAVEATVPHLHEAIEQLRRLDGVAEAERQVKALFLERSARVVDAYRPILRNDLGESGRRLLRLIDDNIGEHVDGEGTAHAAPPS